MQRNRTMLCRTCDKRFKHAALQRMTATYSLLAQVHQLRPNFSAQVGWLLRLHRKLTIYRHPSAPKAKSLRCMYMHLSKLRNGLLSTAGLAITCSYKATLSLTDLTVCQTASKVCPSPTHMSTFCALFGKDDLT